MKKVNAGEELTWEDLASATWSVMGTSSPAGYIYPALWLQDHYGKGISDLKSAVQSDSYASAFARLASGQVDVLVTYADARRDYAERWNTEFSREGSIWEETGVIGVTAPIYNDTISVSKNSEIMDADLIAALQQAFINIGNTDAGKEVIAIYSHNGYQVAQASDYDNERPVPFSGGPPGSAAQHLQAVLPPAQRPQRLQLLRLPRRSGGGRRLRAGAHRHQRHERLCP